MGNVLTYIDTGTATSTAIPTTNTTGTLAIGEQQYFWIYVTGAVMALKGDIATPANYSEALDRTGNRVRLIAEQPWLVAVDAAKAAILVKTPTIT